MKRNWIGEKSRDNVLGLQIYGNVGTRGKLDKGREIRNVKVVQIRKGIVRQWKEGNSRVCPERRKKREIGPGWCVFVFSNRNVIHPTRING